MRAIGFSTGALAKGDFHRALRLLHGHRTTAIEFSALRVTELDALLEYVTSREFPEFAHLAFHAPSRFSPRDERNVAEKLWQLTSLGWPIIVHPDTLHDTELWRNFGDQLCIENMDQRKPVGRTCEEMESLFVRFPDASFCFDIGHAHQVDPSMSHAHCMLSKFASRVRQIHFSEVDSESAHRPVGWIARTAFETIFNAMPKRIPVILEAVVDEAEIRSELQTARNFFHVRRTAA